MPSEYIVPGDYALYGMDPDTTQQEVYAASAVIDGWLQRPLGCVYTVSGSVPVAMAATGAAITEVHSVPTRGVLLLGYLPVGGVIQVEQIQAGVWKATTGWGSYADSLDLTPVNGLYGRAWVRVTYCGGWTYATLPAAIKQACANLVNQPPDLAIPLNISSIRAGDTQLQRQMDTPWDPITQVQLRPYVRVFA